jgi:hypothetical protein
MAQVNKRGPLEEKKHLPLSWTKPAIGTVSLGCRAAILLIGGDKTGDDRFYEKYVPVADDLYDTHLDELRKEGLIK